LAVVLETGLPLPLHRQSSQSQISYSDATNRDIVWTVADPGDTGAIVHGNILNTTDEGSVLLYATVRNGRGNNLDFTERFRFEVLPPAPVGAVTNITVQKPAPSPVRLAVNEAAEFEAWIAPWYATNRNMVWSIIAKDEEPWPGDLNAAGESADKYGLQGTIVSGVPNVALIYEYFNLYRFVGREPGIYTVEARIINGITVGDRLRGAV
jgi:hypothetical protein